jgi:hypothetical protein
MTDGESFEDMTDTIAGFLSDFGGDVELYEVDADGTDSDSEVGRRRFIHADEPVGPDYVVVATEGERFFWLQSQYNLWEDVANEISEADIDEYVPESIGESHAVRTIVPGFGELDDAAKRRFAAAVEILDSLPLESRRDLILQLTAVFTRAGLKHSVSAVREGSGVTGFTVSHRIFPYEGGFTISGLNDTVERVRMAAHMGELLLKYTFNLPVDLGNTESGDVTDPGGLPVRSTRTVDPGPEATVLTEDDFG